MFYLCILPALSIIFGIIAMIGWSKETEFNDDYVNCMLIFIPTFIFLGLNGAGLFVAIQHIHRYIN